MNRKSPWLVVAALMIGVMPLMHAQDNADAERKAAAIRATLAQAPELPLRAEAVIIQAPTPGWNMGGRLVSVASADPQGSVAYVFIRADKDHQPILAVDRQGKIVRSWGSGLFAVPHNIRVDGTGNVWTADAGTSRVIKFTPDGKKVLDFVLGDSPTPAGGGCAFLANPSNGNLDFCGSTDVVVTADGRIFVTDGYGRKRVLEYSPAGDRRVREWGGNGTAPGKFTLPHGLAYDGKGVIFVADRDGGRIERFDLTGRYLGEFSGFGNPGSLSFADNYLWSVVSAPAIPTAGQPAVQQAYIVKIDPATGKLLGKMETRGTDFIDVNASGEVFAGVTAGGFYRYVPVK